MMVFLHFFTFYNYLIFSFYFVSSMVASRVDFLICGDLYFLTL